MLCTVALSLTQSQAWGSHLGGDGGLVCVRESKVVLHPCLSRYSPTPPTCCPNLKGFFLVILILGSNIESYIY